MDVVQVGGFGGASGHFRWIDVIVELDRITDKGQTLNTPVGPVRPLMLGVFRLSFRKNPFRLRIFINIGRLRPGTESRFREADRDNLKVAGRSRSETPARAKHVATGALPPPAPPGPPAGNKSSMWMWLLPIVALALAIRLPKLMWLGPFIDEGGHLYAAVDWNFYSLLDRIRLGKLLGYVLFMPFAHFASNPLVAARAFAACLGGLTTAGIFLTLDRLGGRVTAVVGAAIWAVIPYATFHDRLALHDPIVTCMVIWSLYLSITAVRSNAWPRALASGILLGSAILTKAYAAPFVVWVLGIALAMPGLGPLRRYWKLGIVYLGGVALPCLPLLSYIAKAIFTKNPYMEPLVTSGQDASLLTTNLKTIEGWLEAYLGGPFEVFCGAAILLAVLHLSRLKVALLLPTVVMTLVMSGSLKLFVSRYMLSTLLLLILLVSISAGDCLNGMIDRLRTDKIKPGLRVLSMLQSKAGVYLVVGSLFLVVPFGWSFVRWAQFNGTMLTEPLNLHLAPFDTEQYLTGWASGIGLPEAAQFINSEAERSQEKVLVLAQLWSTGGFGLPWLLKANDKVEVRHSAWRSGDDLIAVTRESAKRPVYLFFEPPMSPMPDVINSRLLPPPERVFEYTPPRSQNRLEFYYCGTKTALKGGVAGDGNALRPKASIVPSSGRGSQQIFSVKVSDPFGASNLAGVALLIGSGVSASGACYILYDIGAVGVDLATDGGSWTKFRGLGTSIVLENSQCRVNLAKSSATAQGTELTLSADVAFKPGFAGSRKVYVYTTTVNQVSDGWRETGVWEVESAER